MFIYLFSYNPGPDYDTDRAVIMHILQTVLGLLHSFSNNPFVYLLNGPVGFISDHWRRRNRSLREKLEQCWHLVSLYWQYCILQNKSFFVLEGQLRRGRKSELAYNEHKWGIISAIYLIPGPLALHSMSSHGADKEPALVLTCIWRLSWCIF